MSTKLLLHMDGDTSTPSLGNDQYTKLLMHFNDNLMDYSDGGASRGSATNAGGASYSTNTVFSGTKGGGKSLYLDSSANSYVYYSDHDDWNRSGTWTIDMWVKHLDHSGTETYVCQYGAVQNFWSISHIDGTGLEYKMNSGGPTVVQLSGGEITDTDWHHVAVTKEGDVYSLYLDGTLTATTTDNSMDLFGSSLYIGSLGSSSQFFYGYIDELRFSNGVARWTSNFTPETEPYGGHKAQVQGGLQL